MSRSSLLPAVVSRRPSSRLSRPTLALVGLMLVTASWGSTFILLRGVVGRMPAADFLAVRFLVAALAVWLVAPGAVRRLSRIERRRGVVLGLVYGAAQLLQTIGLGSTAASVSGFLTGLYVVLTPLLAAVLLGVRLGRRVWIAVGVATLGLALLSLQGLALGGGEALTLAGALFYALHVVGLGIWSRDGAAMGLTVVQLFTVGIVCTVGAAPGGIMLPTTGGDWVVLVYMAIVAGALALVVQTWAQAQISSSRAAIFMTMEPVWAAAFAVVLGGESFGLRALFGGGLVLAAMVMAGVEHTSSSPVTPGPTSAPPADAAPPPRPALASVP